MPVTLDGLMNLDLPARENTYGDRECMLYALGIGLGEDPMNRDELAFCYEKDLKVMPSMATVLVWDDTWAYKSGLDLVKVVHGEQRMRLHRPLPGAATVVARPRVREVYDKGEGRGCLVVIENTISEVGSDAPLVTLESTVFARGDGGFGGPAGSPAPLPAVPECEPDAVHSFATLARMALIYRLCGDRNPLHSDPDFAAAAGFERPILHGLCTWGHACHAVVREVCDYDPSRLTAFGARFTAPVIPGETLEVAIWRADGGAHFRVRALERDAVVLNNGHAEVT